MLWEGAQVSLNASRIVWAAAIKPPTNKLTLLALADYLNEETGRLNPSLQAIADKVGVSRSQAQRIVRDLIEQRLVSVLTNQFGGKPGTTPSYRLNLDRIEALRLTGSTDAVPAGSTDATPAHSTDAPPTDCTHAQEGAHGCAGGVAPMRPKPPMNQKESEVALKRAAYSFDASLIELPEWLPRESWLAWVADRKDRRKPITQRAAAAQIQALNDYRAEGHLPAAVIANSIAAGYLGLFPPKQTGGVHNLGQRRGSDLLDCDFVFGGVRGHA
jgi:hypothetical protein